MYFYTGIKIASLKPYISVNSAVADQLHFFVVKKARFNMTIKRYLFLLFSTLILTVALIQVAMLYVFKAKIEEEVDRRGKNFADMIVNFAIENFETNEVQTQSHDDVIYIQQMPKVKFPKTAIIEIEQELSGQEIETTLELPLRLLSEDQELKLALVELPADAQTLVLEIVDKFNRTKARKVRGEYKNYSVKIFKPRHSHKHSVKKRLKAQIDKFRQNEDKLNNTQIIVNDQGKIKQTWVTKLNENRRAGRDGFLNYLFNGVILLIIITTAVALIMVFWLSKKFSHPLQQLSKGFKKLESGEFGVTVKPNGVQEIKQTIERFNLMSEQLVKLAEAEHKLMQQNHLTELSDISKGIAHALRNPMHTIGLAIEQLAQPDIAEPLKQKLINKIQNKISQLDKNIKALLTVTSGEIERDSKVNLASVVNDIVLELRQSHHLLDKQLELNINVDDTLTLVGSEKEVRTILHTLIFNAYEAGLDNDLSTIKIDLISQSVDDTLQIDVVDNAGGINPDIMQRMFEPHNSSKTEGAGMGLYISKRIAELYYNGSLSLNNQKTNEQITGTCAQLVLRTPDVKD